MSRTEPLNVATRTRGSVPVAQAHAAGAAAPVGYRAPEPPRNGRVPGSGRLELRGIDKNFSADFRVELFDNFQAILGLQFFENIGTVGRVEG